MCVIYIFFMLGKEFAFNLLYSICSGPGVTGTSSTTVKMEVSISSSSNGSKIIIIIIIFKINCVLLASTNATHCREFWLSFKVKVQCKWLKTFSCCGC